MDWEMWLRRDLRGWVRFAVQAKRLDSTDRYSALAHRVGIDKQIDLLSDFCQRNRAVGLYCLYNSPAKVTAGEWHCSLPLDARYLGCSIAPLHVIRTALSTRGGRTFRAIHRDPEVLPFRCMFHDGTSGVSSKETNPLIGPNPTFYGEPEPYRRIEPRLRAVPDDIVPVFEPAFVITVDLLAQN